MPYKPENLFPKKNESRENFMARCMTDMNMQSAYDADQREAVCEVIFDEYDEDERKPAPGTIPSLDLFGEVGYEINARDVSLFLNEAGNSAVRLNVFSGGGSLFEAAALYGMLLRHPGNVTVDVLGIAASAASFFIMGADKIRMDTGSQLMIHNAMSVVQGNPDELRKAADVIEKQQEVMVNAYAKKSGMDREKIQSMLDETTWMIAEEAVEMGFADEIFTAEEMSIAATLSAEFVERFKFKNIPDSIEVTPAAKTPAPTSAKPKPKPNQKGNDMSKVNAQIVTALIAHNPDLNGGNVDEISAEVVAAEIGTLTTKMKELSAEVDTLTRERDNVQDKLVDVQAKYDALQTEAREGIVSKELDGVLAEAGVELSDEVRANASRRVERMIDAEDDELAADIREDLLAYAQTHGIETGESPEIPRHKRKNPKAANDSNEPTLAPEVGVSEVQAYEKKLDAKVQELMAADDTLDVRAAYQQARKQIAA